MSIAILRSFKDNNTCSSASWQITHLGRIVEELTQFETKKIEDEGEN